MSVNIRDVTSRLAVCSFCCAVLASCSVSDSPVVPSEPETGDMGKAPKGVRLIDLGLPSGTKWSNMDIGASGEYQTGLFFAFGETVGYEIHTEHNFYWDTYKWGNGTMTSEGITKYQKDDQEKGCWYDADGKFIGDGKVMLDPEDDAAIVLWGGKWRMPSDMELCELVNNCSSVVDSVNGQRGRLFTSKINGNTIFFAFSGDIAKDEVKGRNTKGYYWSSELSVEKTSQAQTLFIGEENVGVFPGFRFGARPIRPVQSK